MDETSKKGNGTKEPQEAKEAKEKEPSPGEAEKEAVASEVERLRAELDLKEKQARENYDRLLRQAAELENFKKRAAREKGETIRFANEELIKDLLPVVDNLERAVDHAKGGGNGQPLLEGIEMVLKVLVDTLGKYGVKQISAMGEKFDPERHEAIAQVEDQEHEPNTVVVEHHKGYYLLDRLLRPALVSIAKPPETKDKKRNDEEVEKGGNDD